MTDHDLKGVVYLAARTSRSNAYAQAMANAGFRPEKVLIFGGTAKPRLGQTQEAPKRVKLDDLFVPDLSLSLLDSCRSIGSDLEELPYDSVNDPDLFSVLQGMKPDLVIYSGYGGEIISSSLCNAFRLLHLHSGWLPDFRGSTTLYYSWLIAGKCGVSAILMAPEIDAGPVVARKYYPPPPPGADVDHLYDGAIRSDLLIDVLTHYARTNDLPSPQTQSQAEGRTYYVIHPVLKNIALKAHFD